MADLQELAENLIIGNVAEVQRLTQAAINANIPPNEILEEGLVAGMDVVGEKFRNNEYYVPEVLIAARAMKAGMALLRPLLTESGIPSRGKIVLGTVKGDLHDIGKNLVGMMLEGAGFEIIDLGANISAEEFLHAAQQHGARIVGLSALLTTTMIGMRDVVSLIRKHAGHNIKVIVGGAPVTQTFADDIGADGYAPDAASGVDLVKSLLAA